MAQLMSFDWIPSNISENTSMVSARPGVDEYGENGNENGKDNEIAHVENMQMLHQQRRRQVLITARVEAIIKECREMGILIKKCRRSWKDLFLPTHLSATGTL